MSVGTAHILLSFSFFFNDTATTEIYTLSLHDALPISALAHTPGHNCCVTRHAAVVTRDRKSTRLNSSHGYISYAVFCLKKTNQDLDIAAQLTHRRHSLLKLHLQALC